MDTPPETTEATASTTTWSDVADESRSRAETRSELVTDVIKVKITDEALARIARENAADDLTKQELETELEALKEKTKDKKGEIDVVVNRMSERHESVRSGEQTLRGQWKVIDVFATNTVQYCDPDTGKVIYERPMSAAERQQELPLGTTAEAPESGKQAAEAEGEAEAEADEDGTAITDPEGTLNGSAAESEGRVRRRRKKKDAH